MTDTLSNLMALTATCAECRICPGAAYQTPPVLGISDGSEPILVIAQNPGEIKASDETRAWWVNYFAKGTYSTTTMADWYRWDFETSHGHKMFTKVFGEGWLDSGMFAYTNAVRCRTPKNETPSTQMLEACKVYTRSLSRGRRAIIYCGAFAAELIPPKVNDKLKLGVPVRTTDGIILRIPHYAAWKTNDDVASYYRAVQLVIKQVQKGVTK